MEGVSTEMIGQVRERFKAKADTVLLTLDSRLNRILAAWLAIAGSIAACAY